MDKIQKKPKILIIDDSNSLLKLYKHYIAEQSGNEYDIIEAQTCAEGIRLYISERPNCVILDFVLPDGNGLGVIEKLSELHEPLPIIMATSYGNDHLAVDAIQAGAQDYLIKDKITPESLILAIQNTIQRVDMLRTLEVKNSELQSFLHIISHDFMEPLNSCTGLLQLTMEHNEGALDDKTNEYMKKSLNCIAHAQDMIHDLLSYATLGTQEKDFSTVDCNEVVTYVTTQLEVLISNQHALISTHNLPKITGVQSLINLLFQNLIQNAIKYGDKEITKITINCTEENSRWVFAVQDNGKGIAAEHHDSVFGIFKRVEKSSNTPGSGLGLTTCEKIVAMHGGKMWLESEVDKGTTFYFSIHKKPLEANEIAA